MASSTGRDATIGAATDAGLQACGSVPTPRGLAPPARPPRLQPPSTPSQPPSFGAASFSGACCSTASSSTRTASTLDSPVLATPVGRPVMATPSTLEPLFPSAAASAGAAAVAAAAAAAAAAAEHASADAYISNCKAIERDALGTLPAFGSLLLFISSSFTIQCSVYYLTYLLSGGTVRTRPIDPWQHGHEGGAERGDRMDHRPT